MTLQYADRCAERLVGWLSSFAERVEVAGSVRRRRPAPNDIDLVVIPRMEEQKDLFGNVTARRNATWVEIDRRITEDGWHVLRASADLASWVAGSVQVDVFWTTPERWGTSMLCRTGSKEHNIWLATYAQTLGAKWHPGEGLFRDHRIYAATEEQIYGALNMRPIPPEEREANRLLHAGLIRTPAQGGPVGVVR